MSNGLFFVAVNYTGVGRLLRFGRFLSANWFGCRNSSHRDLTFLDSL